MGDERATSQPLAINNCGITAVPRGRPFQKGVAANPKGAPKGPHRMTREIHKIAGEAGPAIVRKIIEGAKGGDPFLQSLYARHLLPRTKLNPEPETIEQPKTAAEAAQRIAGIVASIANGTLDLDTAQAMIAGLQVFVNAFNVAETERRAEEGREEIARLKTELAEMMALAATRT
jgi:hypothetical protein